MSITNLTVPVPTDRVAEFYRMFADWVDGSTGRVPPAADVPAQSKAGAAPTGAPPAKPDLDAAIRWWRLLKPREREVFSLWIAAAPKMLTAAEIVDKLGLNGPRDIPGILSWPGRKGHKVGFEVHWSFRHDPVSEEPVYGLEDVEFAEIIGRARTAVEGA